jgi:ubiquinone/menaquinone biosynthesis C-methylase UbiE
MAAEFDKLSYRYENNRLSSWYKASNRILINSFSKSLSLSILDIGCATGWLLRQTIKENLIQDGVGIDIAPQMIKIATEAAEIDKTINLTFINTDWEKIEFNTLNNKKFDAVICAHTFHYFRDPMQALKKIYGCLKNGGIFYLMERDITDSALTYVWGKVHERILRDRVRFYSGTKLKNMMVQAGFTDTSIKKRVKGLFWKNKMYTSLVILQGLHKQ